MTDKEKCPECGNTEFMIVRDMTSRRLGRCGHEWPCPAEPGATQKNPIDALTVGFEGTPEEYLKAYNELVHVHINLDAASPGPPAFCNCSALVSSRMPRAMHATTCPASLADAAALRIIELEQQLASQKVDYRILGFAIRNVGAQLEKALADNANPSEAIKRERDEMKAYQASVLEEKNAEIARLKELMNVTEVKMLDAFAKALNVNDALGWGTGQLIREYLFRPNRGE